MTHARQADLGSHQLPLHGAAYHTGVFAVNRRPKTEAIMYRMMLAAAAIACYATTALAVHDAFRENESRWYVQVSFNDSKGSHGMHYIGGTWGSKELCEEALKTQKAFLTDLASSAMQQRGEVTDVKYFCGIGSWQDRPGE